MPKIKENCGYCGEKKDGSYNGFCSKSCANESSRLYNKCKRQLFKLGLGGKCVSCGDCVELHLQVDHIIPEKWHFGNMTTLEQMNRKGAYYQHYSNISNLQLLCANCHLEKTVSERMIYKYAK